MRRIPKASFISLSHLPNLKVMSRDSAFRYKGKDTDAQTVARELGVRTVLKGRVTQLGGNLAISAELIDATDSSHIWGQQYSRKRADIFALQEKIAKEITKALRLRLTGQEEKSLAKTYTTNPEAYRGYLQGRFWWNKRTEDGFNKGIECFQQAIAKDPARFGLLRIGRLLQHACKLRFPAPPNWLFESQRCGPQSGGTG
jgi:hypothetical protein